MNPGTVQEKKPLSPVPNSSPQHGRVKGAGDREKELISDAADNTTLKVLEVGGGGAMQGPDLIVFEFPCLAQIDRS